jgi:radical SAM superfamily enzyme YgiQ (UPF0313 family)
MERVIEFCNRIKNYNINWVISARVTDINENLVKILKDSHCIAIYLGIESADNNILKSMKKSITIEQTEKALEIIYNSGIHVLGMLIFGDVEETIETATTTLNWWKRNTKYGIGMNFITTYPGTELYKYAIKNNIIKDSVQFIKDGCPTINVSKMSSDEVKYIASEIVTLTKQNLKEPLDISNFQIDSSGYKVSFEGRCYYCNRHNIWNNVKLLHRSNICCSECGTKHKTPINDNIIKNMDKKIEELIKNYGKIAFWGINYTGLDWIERLDTSKNNNVFIIDVSKMKQNSFVNNKQINHPEVINRKNIKCVIVPIMSLYSGIKLQIEQQYPEVQVIENMLNLMK